MKKEETVMTFDPRWEFRRLDPNILTLDYCRYKIGEYEWSNPMPVWKAQKSIREKFGLRPIWHNGGVSFWKAEELGLNEIAVSKRVSLKFTFTTNSPAAGMSLMLETPEIFEISLNGKEVRFKSSDAGTHIDPCFRTIDITGLSRSGENEIVLTCDYRGQYELESIYLLGDFAVFERNGDFVLDDEPEFLQSGDWVTQGYPFYSGTIRCEAKFTLKKEEGKYFVSFGGIRAIVTNVLINGRDCGSITWKPYRLDVTESLREGENRMSIDLITSLRNTLGPHHYTGNDASGMVSPRTFTDEKNWSDSYSFVPYGIFDETCLLRIL